MEPGGVSETIQSRPRDAKVPPNSAEELRKRRPKGRKRSPRLLKREPRRAKMVTKRVQKPSKKASKRKNSHM